MQNLKVAHVLKLQYPGALEIADSSTLAAQPPSLQCEPLAAVTVGIQSGQCGCGGFGPNHGLGAILWRHSVLRLLREGGQQS